MKRKLMINGLNRLAAGSMLWVSLAMASLALAGKGGGKGKPGGGDGGDGGGDPPPPPATTPVDYQLTFVDGFGGGSPALYGVNASGEAVGRDRDGSGAQRSFWVDASGTVTAFDDYFNISAGWSVGSESQINEAGWVCGIVKNQATSSAELFLADLADPNSFEFLGTAPSNGQKFHLNANGDIAFLGSLAGTQARPFVYVRSQQTLFDYDGMAYWPTGLNDQLELSLVAYTVASSKFSSYPYWSGAARMTITDPVTRTAQVDGLGSATQDYLSEPISYALAIDNHGTVYGGFETNVSSKGKGRSSDARAGTIGLSDVSWSELDAALPTGSQKRSGFEGVVMAACALDANESGQVVGGYDVLQTGSSSLWLKDPADGLFNLDDAVVGEPTDVDAFRAADDIRDVVISEPNGTGYGIISGWILDSGSYKAFILTSQPVSAP